MTLKFSKANQLYKHRDKKQGSELEAPVQECIDDCVKLFSMDSFRVTDSFWRWIHNPANGVRPQDKKMCSKLFAGWPDTMIFEQLTDKYLIVLPLEAKSRTGRFNGNKQRNMAKRLNYQVPRSPEQAMEMIVKFRKEAERLRELLKGENDK